MSKGQRARGNHGRYRAPLATTTPEYTRPLGRAYAESQCCAQSVVDEHEGEVWCCERVGHRGLCLSPSGLAWDAGTPSVIYRLEAS